MGAKAVLDLINLWIELWLPWGESVCHGERVYALKTGFLIHSQ